jgi:hypothetical protein
VVGAKLGLAQGQRLPGERQGQVELPGGPVAFGQVDQAGASL